MGGIEEFSKSLISKHGLEKAYFEALKLWKDTDNEDYKDFYNEVLLEIVFALENEHTWFCDDSFEPSDNSSLLMREICVYCDDMKYWYLYRQNGVTKKGYYIMCKDTQKQFSTCKKH